MIAIQPRHCGREHIAILASGYDYYFGKPKDSEHTVVGSVEWCERFLPPVTPDYYPEYLQPWMFRLWGVCNKWPLGKRLFIKPADSYKRFTGLVTNGGYKGKKRGPYVWSQPVTFEQEWRYYVSDGDVVTTGWYNGHDEEEPAPPLPFLFPKVCGAFDFGRLDTGQLALVEAHHPYACGWYGEFSKHKAYVTWLIRGWEYINERKNK